MAIHSLQKRHSWPAYRSTHNAQNDTSLDQNPFAHFVSSPEDQSLSSDGDLDTAGISPARRSARRRHSLSPDLRRTRACLLRHGPSSSPTFKLKQWIERFELRFLHRSPQIIEICPRSPQRTESIRQPAYSTMLPQRMSLQSDTSQAVMVSPPVRGRREYRVGSKQRAGRRRPRAWSVPSGELWTVTEETDGELGLGIFEADGGPYKAA